MTKNVITIGREFGSGGRAIAKILGQRLGYKVYDKEIVELAAAECNLSKEVIEDYDERTTNSFLYSLSLGAYSFNDSLSGVPQIPLVDKVYSEQEKIIKNLAEKGSCIIIGRCSDYILRGVENVLNVFICSDIDIRAKHIMEFENIGYDAAISLIRKSDRKRSNYHNYFAESKWGVAKSYDLCVNSKIGYENVADIIQTYLSIDINKTK